MFDKPFMIIDSSSWDSSLVFNYFSQRQKEAKQEHIWDDILGSSYSSVAF